MKKILVSTGLVLFSLFFLFAQSTKESTGPVEPKVLFVDSCNRRVEVPEKINKVAVSGNVATMFMTALAPEYMTNINAKISDDCLAYLPAAISKLPITGQLYGGKSSINEEEILALGAQVLIDMGDYKKGIEKDLDDLQNKTGIPCIFIEADVPNMVSAFETLGSLLDKKDRAAELSSYISDTLEMAKQTSALIPENERKSVMFTAGSDGLGTNAKGSSQAQVIDIVGCDNAIVLPNVTSKGNGNLINMEMLYGFDPDVIVFCEDSYFDFVKEDKTWSVLKAVKNNTYYEVPCKPYCWMGNPPSINMIMGIWYLGNLVYPKYYNYNINVKANEFYNLFWGCDCPYEL